MLINKVEEGNLINATYASSNVVSSIYDKQLKELIIIFVSGRRYIYYGVTYTDYIRFEVADSQGSVISSHIKKYVTERLDDVNVNALLVENKAAIAAEMDEVFNNTKGDIITSLNNTLLYENEPRESFITVIKQLKSILDDFIKTNTNNEKNNIINNVVDS